MNLSNRQIIGIVALFGVTFWAYQKGYFSPERGRNLDPATTVTDNSTQTLSTAQVANLVNSYRTTVAEAVPGSIFFGSDAFEDLLRRTNALKDADLIAVSNAYNSKYPNDEYKTIYALISSVYLGWGTVWYEREKLQNRLLNLGAA